MDNLASFKDSKKKSESSGNSKRERPKSPGRSIKPDEVTWKTLPQLGHSPMPRNCHSAAFWPPSKLMIFGGQLRDYEPAPNHRWHMKCNETYCYDISSYTWTKIEVSGVPPSPRFLHTSVVWRDKLVIFGGLGGNGQVRLNDVHVLDLCKQEWSAPKVTGTIPEARSHHAGVLVGNYYYIFGGLSPTFSKLNDVQQLDLENMIWSPLECTGPLPEGRLGPHVAIYQNGLYAYGGYTGKFRLGDVHRLDLGTKIWSPVSTNGQIPRKRMCATVNALGSKLVLIGGNIPAHTAGCNEAFTEACSVLDLETSTWSEILPVPEKIASHTTVSLPDGKLLVYGAISPEWVANIHVLDPATVPQLRFWTYSEAKSAVKKELVAIKQARKDKDDDLDSKCLKITSVLQSQLDRITAEELALKAAKEDLTRRIQNFEKEKDIMRTYLNETGSIVYLDIGGQHFKTTITTLQSVEGSMLASMFSGRYPLPRDLNGYVFIDRDGTHFRYILNYLRDGKFNAPNDVILYKDLHAEAEYYQLLELAEELREKIIHLESRQ